MYVYVKLTDYTLVIQKDDRRHVYRKDGFRSRASRERLMRLLKGAEYHPSLERDGMDTAIIEEWIIAAPSPAPADTFIYEPLQKVRIPGTQRREGIVDRVAGQGGNYYAVCLLGMRGQKWYSEAELTAANPVNPAIREAFRLQTALCAALDMDEAAYTHEAQQLVASGKIAPDANKFTVDSVMMNEVLMCRYRDRAMADPAWFAGQREIVKAGMS